MKYFKVKLVNESHLQARPVWSPVKAVSIAAALAIAQQRCESVEAGFTINGEIEEVSHFEYIRHLLALSK